MWCHLTWRRLIGNRAWDWNEPGQSHGSVAHSWNKYWNRFSMERPRTFSKMYLSYIDQEWANASFRGWKRWREVTNYTGSRKNRYPCITKSTWKKKLWFNQHLAKINFLRLITVLQFKCFHLTSWNSLFNHGMILLLYDSEKLKK